MWRERSERRARGLVDDVSERHVALPVKVQREVRKHPCARLPFRASFLRSIFVWIPPGPLVGVGSPGPPTLFYDVGVMAPELDTTRAFAASLSSLLDPEDEGLAMLPREVFSKDAQRVRARMRSLPYKHTFPFVAHDT